MILNPVLAAAALFVGTPDPAAVQPAASAAAKPPHSTAPGRPGEAATPVGKSSKTDAAPFAPLEPIARIREEGLNHSHVMETLEYLTDVIGPRLTGSPAMKRANEWTRDQLFSWGLQNAHLEPWGPFGRGWTLRRFSAEVISPQCIPLIACPKAWSGSTRGPVRADVVELNAATDDELKNYKGKLKGAAVLLSPSQEIRPHFEADCKRDDDSELLDLANATAAGSTYGPVHPVRRSQMDPARLAALRMMGAKLQFAISEGAAVILDASQGDDGTVFVQSAFAGQGQGVPPSKRKRAWDSDAPAIVPQVTVSGEQYNRILRLLHHGEKVTVEINLTADYQDADRMAYNTVAEIPGTDLKNEIVMAGGHMDSWHSATGATDNAAGAAIVMEAVRILQALHLPLRRTVRVALWSGEEEGLLGSQAYVKQHLGYYEGARPMAAPQPFPTPGAGPPVSGAGAPPPTGATGNPAKAPVSRVVTTAPAAPPPPLRTFIPGPEFERLSVYFNLDNGAGKIRGIQVEGNEAVVPLFRQWLAPFKDLDASTVSLAASHGTDHESFDHVGVPGFEFIQDSMDYFTRTHHSNQDVLDRIVPEDMKQASTIMAAFLYDAANAESRVPRKPSAQSR